LDLDGRDREIDILCTACTCAFAERVRLAASELGRRLREEGLSVDVGLEIVHPR